MIIGLLGSFSYPFLGFPAPRARDETNALRPDALKRTGKDRVEEDPASNSPDQSTLKSTDRGDDSPTFAEDQPGGSDERLKPPKEVPKQKTEISTEPLYDGKEPLCFVVGSGIDVSHKEFKKGQILQLSDPTDGMPPTLQRGSYRLPSDLGDRSLDYLLHETQVASIIGGRYCGIAPGTKMVDMYVAYDGEDEHGQVEYSEEGLLRNFQKILAFMKANPEVPAVVNVSLGRS